MRKLILLSLVVSLLNLGPAKHTKGVITQDQFMEKVKAERATYQAMFEKTRH